MDDDGQAIIEVPAPGDDVPVEAPWYPPWAPWALWIPLVAAMVSFAVEWPKQWWIKPTAVWKRTRNKGHKVRLLAPLLLLFGAALGGPIFHEAGLLESPLLCAALGAGVGVLSSPIYDATWAIINAIPDAVKSKLGVSTDADADASVGDTDEVPALPDPFADGDAKPLADGEPG